MRQQNGFRSEPGGGGAASYINTGEYPARRPRAHALPPCPAMTRRAVTERLSTSYGPEADRPPVYAAPERLSASHGPEAGCHARTASIPCSDHIQSASHTPEPAVAGECGGVGAAKPPLRRHTTSLCRLTVRG